MFSTLNASNNLHPFRNWQYAPPSQLDDILLQLLLLRRRVGPTRIFIRISYVLYGELCPFLSAAAKIDIHPFRNSSRRWLNSCGRFPRQFICIAAPCRLRHGIPCAFRGELCLFSAVTSPNDIHPFRNHIRAPPSSNPLQFICIAASSIFLHEF